MRQLGWTLLLLLPLLGLGHAHSAAPEPASSPRGLPASIEPVILLERQSIAACGVSARYG